MKCPNAEKGFCPAKEGVNEYHNEWMSEYYCMTCGYEGIERYTTLRKVVRDIAPPMPKKIRKKSRDSQGY